MQMVAAGYQAQQAWTIALRLAMHMVWLGMVVQVGRYIARPVA